MKLTEKFEIKFAESLRWNCEGSLDKVPVLFIEFNKRRSTRPLIYDFMNFLREKYKDVEIPEPRESPNIASVGSKSSLMEYLIQPEPYIFQIRVDCRQEDINAKIWFFEGYQRYGEDKVNCCKIIDEYIERLNKDWR